MSEALSAQNTRTRRLEQRFPAPLVGNLPSALDRSLPVPLGVQLRGLIEYGIACGELVAGTQLPSVRDLAEAGGVAPMTVSAVYKDLRAAGLLVTRPGAGTFIAETSANRLHDPETLQRLERHVDALLLEAGTAGLSTADMAALFNVRVARVRAREARALNICMVGVFQSATEAYAADIARQLRGQDTIRALTIEQLRSGTGPSDAVDLYVTLANRRLEVEALVAPDPPVVSISFIPAERTRTRLAAIDPVARIGIVSVVPEFLALMKPGVLRFTPHVQSVEVALAGDPRLAAFLERANVVVYATGAERVLSELPPGVEAIEYRHVPDPHAVQRELLPAIERLRAGLPLKETSA
jgi:DNA-binding transcriptional regulator YhcF (GntR family)